MAQLEFFGWVLNGVQAGTREYFPAPEGGKYWGAQDLFVETKGHIRYLYTRMDRSLKLQLEKLPIEIEIIPDRVVVEALPSGRWRLLPAEDSIFIRMGRDGPANGLHRFIIGPAVFHDQTWPKYQFGADGVALISLASEPQVQRFFIDSSNLDSSENPLSIQLGPQPFTLNLATRTLELPKGGLTARLRSALPESSRKNHSVKFHSLPLTFTFRALAYADPFYADFIKLPDEDEVRLNLALTGDSRPGIEVLKCLLRLQIEKSRNKATAALTDAVLLPEDGNALELCFHGAWNSKNEPELWSCANEVRLAFRIGWSRTSDAKKNIWSSVMLRPDQTLTGLRRLNGLSNKNVQLPLHGDIPGAQFQLTSATTATLIVSKGAAERDRSLKESEWRAAPALVWSQSRPWVRFTDTKFRYARPGDSYSCSEPWLFTAPTSRISGGVPAIPFETWFQGDKPSVGNDEVDKAFGNFLLVSMSGLHETGLLDATDELAKPLPQIQRVMPKDLTAQNTHTLILQNHVKVLELPTPASLTLLPVPRIAASTPTLQAITFSVQTPPAESGFEYSVCWEGASLPSKVATFMVTDWSGKVVGRIDASVPIGIGNVANDKTRPKTLPQAILKVGRQRGLDAILRELEPFSPTRGKQQTGTEIEKVISVIRETDPDILLPTWVGLVAFSLPIDFSEFAALQNTMPIGKDGGPRLEFYALAPRHQISSQPGTEGTAAISAAVSWESKVASTEQRPSYDSPKEEVSFWPNRLDIRFKQSRMTAFNAELFIEFRAFFGIGNPSKQKRQTGSEPISNKRVRIIGSAKKTDPSNPSSPVEFRFAANVKDPIRIYPLRKEQDSEAKESFLEGAWFKRLELVDIPGDAGRRRTQFRVDGDIEFRKPEGLSLAGEFLTKIQGRRISFLDLGIDVTGAPSINPKALQISYPSLAFNLDLPHVELFGKALRMKLHQLALNWDGGFELPGFIPLGLESPEWNQKLPNIFFVGRIDFGSLPALFARSLSGFSLELGLGLNFDRDNASLGKGRQIVIRGFGFDRLDFDLLQFLQLSIETLRLGALPITPSPGVPKGAHLSLEKVSVKVLQHEIFKDATGGFFSRQNGEGDGFWAYFPEKQDGEKYLIGFDWGFVAKNVDFTPEVAKSLLVPPPQNQGVADADNAKEAGKKLATYWHENKIGPSHGAAGTGWTFAAGMTMLNEALRGRVLIQDSGFAGLSLWGVELKKWFGYDFAFCGIYRRNLTPGEDYFFVSTTLPAVTLGTIHFTGGIVELEIYTSGDFMLDFGFPWPGPSGGREWRRTIGAIITPGQASAGFYLRKRETALSSEVSDGKLLTVSAGFALQWGLGAAFGGGVFKAWVRLGLFAILEGEAAIHIREKSLALRKLTVAGAGGVLVEGEGSINWWVISVRVYVCASAEVGLLMTWTADSGSTTLALRAELYVGASAEACVGGGWFKVCRSITVGLNIPVTYQLAF